MNLYLVCDGPRDQGALLELVKTILERHIEAARCESWKAVRLHKGTGYDRKIRLVIQTARDRGWDGVVATVDQDKAPVRERLKKLQEGRAKERENYPALPTALGEARPHFDVWLLDDSVAVAHLLSISNESVPNVRDADNPKEALHGLMVASDLGETPMEFGRQLAAQLEPSRCPHAKKTGFQSFIEDLRHEFL